MKADSTTVQRQAVEEEEEEPVQAKPLAYQITPLVQKQVEPEKEEEEPIQAKSISRDEAILQRQEVPEEEEEVQTKPSFQRQTEEEEEEVVQGKFTPSETPAQLQGEGGGVENRTGMPNSLRTGLETLSGMDLSGIRVHSNSSKPAQLNALAYTQGQDIHVGPGQEKHLPHEGWHAVQQMQGRVKPTMQVKGVSINDEKGLEAEADNFGKKAVLGETLSKYQSPGLGIRNSLRTVQTKSNIIQCAVTTSGGTWDTDQYDLRKDEVRGRRYPAAMGVRGVDIKLKFTPGNNVDTELIGLTQSVQAFVGGKASYTGPTNKSMSIKSKDAININTGKGETDEGTAIDRLHTRNNPIYGSPSLGKGKNLEDTPMDNNPSGGALRLGVNATYQLGYHYKSGKTLKKQNAMLFDGPTRSGAAKDSRHIFETTALAIKGTQSGAYYGSVRWGWRTDSKSNFTKIPLQVVSQGVPSSTFMKAAEIWNASKTSTGSNTVDLPIKDVKLISNFAGVDIGLGPVYIHLPKGTRVVEMPGFPSMTETYIRVVDGPYTGKTGKVPNSDLVDERS
ncbi:MAG: DUF4157 domain-containing protein [Deltaproteobacteria bacterium]|nr:DUF4157 domain-containing protein [Deltaproteobacteria bacterium]